jgi:hypothetical protein
VPSAAVLAPLKPVEQRNRDSGKGHQAVHEKRRAHRDSPLRKNDAVMNTD